MTETFVLLLRVVLSLGVVLGLLWFLARRVNGQFSRDRTAHVNVVSRVSLSRHAGVAVVEVDQRRLLLGIADTGVTLLTELDPEDSCDEQVSDEPGEEPGDEEGAGIREFIHADLAEVLDAAPPLSSRGRAARRAKHAWNREVLRVQGQEAPPSESILAPGTWRRAWESVQGRQ